MTYSITFYLRRRKYIYCTIRINGLDASRSTGITVHNHKAWTGRYLVDDRNKKLSEATNTRLKIYYDEAESLITSNLYRHNLTPTWVFDHLGAGNAPSSGKIDVPTTLLEAARYYIDTNHKMKRYSSTSIKTYKNISEKILPGFLESLGVDDILLSQFKTPIAKQYKGYLNQAGYGPKTQSLYITFLKSVFKMILEDFPIDEYPEVGVTYNPCANRSLKTTINFQKNLEEFVYPSKEAVLWDLYKESKDDYLLLAILMWNTGLSFGDTSNNFYVTKDFGSQEDIFRYHRTKTNIDARVLMYPELKTVLEELSKKENYYQDKFNNKLPIRNFIDKDGEIIIDVYQGEYQRFYHYLKDTLAGKLSETRLTPHKLRHSFAVKMISKGHSLDAVKVMMAHSTIVTTEKHYAYIVDSRLINEKRKNDDDERFRKAE